MSMDTARPQRSSPLYENFGRQLSAPPSEPAPTELFIVRDTHAARSAGFGGPTVRHTNPRFRHVLCWWPEMGTDRLRGMRFDRITICPLSNVSSDTKRAILSYCTHEETAVMDPMA